MQFYGINRHLGNRVFQTPSTNWIGRPLFLDYFGNIKVSTIFLGIDHNHTGKGEPILFETMVFKGNKDVFQYRCSTYSEAEKIHQHALTLGYLQLPWYIRLYHSIVGKQPMNHVISGELPS